MEFIIAVLLGGVILFFVFIFIMWAENGIPEKINEISAEGEMSKFENSPVTEYAVSKVVNGMSIAINGARRDKEYENVSAYYVIGVNEKYIYGQITDEYDNDLTHDYSWHYDFCSNRYPDLVDAADRTALAMVVMKKATAELRHLFPKDKSGSTDVKFTYRKIFYQTTHHTVIKIHYTATNLYYEELKSW